MSVTGAQPAPIRFFYTHFHNSIRTELELLAKRAQELDGPNTVEQNLYPKLLVLRERYKFLEQVYRYHSSVEDEVVYPALDAKVKNVTVAYSVEHQEEEMLLEQLAQLISAAISQAGADRGDTIRGLICKTEEIHRTLKKHLAKEGEQLQPLILQHFTYAEQAELVAQFIYCIPLAMVEKVLAWLKPSVPKEEQMQLLHHITTVVPDHLLLQLLTTWLSPDSATNSEGGPPRKKVHAKPPRQASGTGACLSQSTAVMIPVHALNELDDHSNEEPACCIKARSCPSYSRGTCMFPPNKATAQPDVTATACQVSMCSTRHASDQACATAAVTTTSTSPGASIESTPVEREVCPPAPSKPPLKEIIHIHRTIVRALDEFACEARTLQARSDVTGVQVASLVERHRFLRSVCMFHTISEEEVMYPEVRRLAASEPSLAAAYGNIDGTHGAHDSCNQCEQEHESEVSALENLGRLLADVRAFARRGRKEVTAMLAKLSTTAEQVCESIRGHMEREEAEVFPLLERHLCATQQRAMVWRTLRAMPLRLLERVMPWVTANLSEDDTAQLLDNIRKGAPEPDSALVELLTRWADKGRGLGAVQLGGHAGALHSLTPSMDTALAGGVVHGSVQGGGVGGGLGTSRVPSAELGDAEDRASGLSGGKAKPSGDAAANATPQLSTEEPETVRAAKRLRVSESGSGVVGVVSPVAAGAGYPGFGDVEMRDVSPAGKASAAVGAGVGGAGESGWPQGHATTVKDSQAPPPNVVNGAGATAGAARVSGLVEVLSGGVMNPLHHQSALAPAADPDPDTAPGPARSQFNPIDHIFQFHHALRMELRHLEADALHLEAVIKAELAQKGLELEHARPPVNASAPGTDEAAGGVAAGGSSGSKSSGVAVVATGGEERSKLAGAASMPHRLATSSIHRAPSVTRVNSWQGLAKAVEGCSSGSPRALGDVRAGTPGLSAGSRMQGSPAPCGSGMGLAPHMLAPSLPRNVATALQTLEGRFQFLWGTYRAHSRSEDEIVFPALESKHALRNVSHAYTLDHQQEEQLFLDLEVVVDVLRRSNTVEEAQEHVLSVRRMCAAVRASLETHIRAEEAELWPLFTEHFTTEEQQYLAGVIIGRTGAQVLTALLPWITESFSSEEQQQMMGSLREATKNTMFDQWLEAVTAQHTHPGTAWSAACGNDCGQAAPGGARRGSDGAKPAGCGSCGSREGRICEPGGLDPEVARYLASTPAPAEPDQATEGGAAGAGAGEATGSRLPSCSAPVESCSFRPGWEDIFRMNQKQLEAAVMRVSADPNLEPSRKAYLIQNIMVSKYIVAQQKRMGADEEAKCVAGQGTGASTVGSGGCGTHCHHYPPGTVAKSYHDAAKGVLGCKHYKRKVQLVAPCCNKVFPCRLCHDEAVPHRLDRYAISEMVCMACGTRGPVGATCSNCEARASRYYCSICHLFDDEPGRHIYHCPFCNVCRRGRGLGIDFFHCMTCNSCMSLSVFKTHKCRERAMEANCPVCSEYLFDSADPIKELPCGHLLHSQCFAEYTRYNYTCPLCSKSVGDMRVYFQMLDSLLASERLPPEYAGRMQQVLCNDCGKSGFARFHFAYHSCPHCRSYNTRVL